MVIEPTYEELKEHVASLRLEAEKNERLSSISVALLEISSGVNATADPAELFRTIHQILSRVVDTTNFYIALYTAEKDSIHFPYIVDTVDGEYPPVMEISKSASLTAEVIRTGKPLMLSRQEIDEYRKESDMAIPCCTTSAIWLGVPLKARNRLVGVMAVQSYDTPNCYDSLDLEVMTAAGLQVGLAIHQFLAEESLKVSESRYRGLLDLAVEGVMLGSPQGIITDANRNMCEMIGFQREELVGNHISVLPFTKESIERFPFRFDLLEKGEKVVSERVIIRPDGVAVHIEMRTRMMPDGNLQAIFSDITERKKAEAALKESEERFRLLHNASFGGIAIHDQGVIVDCNQGLADMMGYGVEEMVGMNGFDLITPETLDIVLQKVREGYEQEYEVTAQRKDGSTFPIRIRGTVIPYKGKTVRVTEFRDISEQKRVEQEHRHLEEQLHQAQKMETIGQLAGGVAHDFNNMLGVIIGHAEMGLSKVDDTSPIYFDLQQIRKAAGRSAEITRQLLAFARKQAVSPRIVDLNDTVEGMLQMLHRLIGEDIELAWSPGENVGAVLVDTSQLDQIMVNLCVNARDAIDGVGRVEVATSAVVLEAGTHVGEPVPVTGKYTQISVRDNGSGIDEANLEHIFEPFFTTKGTGKGTGLGLATVYGVVKQNNGFIEVNSERGDGTTFTIYLPGIDDGVVPEIHHQVNDGTAHGMGTILVVEDEEAILEMTRAMLERFGYTVLAAETPARALELGKGFEGTIDLVLTDVVMPEMNGRDLMHELQRIRPQLKCVYMSGYTADIISKQGVLEDGVLFIQKPFSQEDLFAKVHEAVR